MEPASLTLSVVGLAGLFSNAVDCFEYIQLGRSFGRDYQTALIKLDALRLKLSRWGEATGIVNDTDGVQPSERGMKLAREDIPAVEELLEQIHLLFTEAERRSQSFSKRAGGSSESLAVYVPTHDLDRTGASLHHRMKDLAIKRQKKTGLRQKAKWALYEGKQVSRLLEDLDDLVSKLVELCPNLKEEQKRLCRDEISGMDESVLLLLHKVAADQDRMMSEIISNIGMASSAQAYSRTIGGNHNSGVILMENTGSMNLSWGMQNGR